MEEKIRVETTLFAFFKKNKWMVERIMSSREEKELQSVFVKREKSFISNDKFEILMRVQKIFR
jgi:predicted ATP-grasp superfamily ATP-dependent carboligase